MKRSDYPNKVMYLWIAVTVVVFNLIAIFGLDIMLHDDPERYWSVITDTFPDWRFRYATLAPYKEWIAWNIMTYSPELARGLYVVLFMVPISMCFYYLWYCKFGFSQLAAFTAAVLPNILPSQWQMPAGINMSYSLHGLLIVLISLVFAFQYLKKSTAKNYLRLLAAAALFYLASQILEQTLFLFPPVVLAFLAYTKLNKKHVWLISLYFISALLLYFRMTQNQRVKPTDLQIDAIIDRVAVYFQWALPFPQLAPAYTITIFLVVVVTGFWLFIRSSSENRTSDPGYSHISDKMYGIYLYIFLSCWTLATIGAFLLVSPTFSPRYIYISAFGLNALLVLSLYQIVHRGILIKFKTSYVLLIGLVVFAGTTRYLELNQNFHYKNQTKSIIVRDLAKLELPPDAQIVITGIGGIPGGWYRSTGYLMYALQREDVSGLLGPANKGGYYNFDNHFSERKSQQLRFVFTGLSIEKPVMFFEMDKANKKLKQLEYALQWKGESMNAPWTIVQADKNTGVIRPFKTGLGMAEYTSTLESLEKLGVSQSDILWGGPPTPSELKRLQRYDLDPPLLETGIYAAMNLNLRTRIRSGKVLSSHNEEEILSIINTIDTLQENVNFADRFQMVTSFVDDVPNKNGKIENTAVFILWKSLIKQTLDKPLVAAKWNKGDVEIAKTYLAFTKPGTEVKAGDLIVTPILLPAAKFKAADYLGITLYESTKPKKPLSPMSGNVDKTGRRLLIKLD